MNYVTIYKVEQAYGGPEEGGWWFNVYEAVKSKPCRRKRQVREWKRKFEREIEGASTGRTRILGYNGPPIPDDYDPVAPSDDYGVVYGADYIVVTEKVPHEREYQGRPHYE